MAPQAVALVLCKLGCFPTGLLGFMNQRSTTSGAETGFQVRVHMSAVTPHSCRPLSDMASRVRSGEGQYQYG